MVLDHTQSEGQILVDHVGLRFNSEHVLQPPGYWPKYLILKINMGALKNDGNQYTNEVGTWDGYGNVWLCQGGITNILYMDRSNEIYMVDLHIRHFTVTRYNNVCTYQEKEKRSFHTGHAGMEEGG